MKFRKFLIFSIFFITISCAKQRDSSVIVKLSFNMSLEEIKAYYKTIDDLVDKREAKIFLGEVDSETREKIITERSDKNKYFEEDVEFLYNGSNMWGRSPVKPDGYVNFNNYYYRNIDESYMPSKNFIQYAEEGINPLKCSPGFIITEKDIPVYERYYKETQASEWTYDKNISDWESVEWKEVGLLKSGTVIKLNGISINNYLFVVQELNLQGYIKATDIALINYLRSNVSYKIEDEKLYRFIEGQKIEINIGGSESGYYENGYKYIRNEYYNNDLDRFYFWEILGDYLFDENGNFIDVVEYGPDWTDM